MRRATIYRIMIADRWQKAKTLTTEDQSEAARYDSRKAAEIEGYRLYRAHRGAIDISIVEYDPDGGITIRTCRAQP